MMDDSLIKRQDAIIAGRSHRIDINDPKKIVSKSYEDVIRELPSAQPEIIRCGECKHWREDRTCGEHSLVSPMMAYEFCSRAERRQDEHIG